MGQCSTIEPHRLGKAWLFIWWTMWWREKQQLEKSSKKSRISSRICIFKQKRWETTICPTEYLQSLRLFQASTRCTG
jgi:hypothetical protein